MLLGDFAGDLIANVDAGIRNGDFAPAIAMAPKAKRYLKDLDSRYKRAPEVLAALAVLSTIYIDRSFRSEIVEPLLARLRLREFLRGKDAPVALADGLLAIRNNQVDSALAHLAYARQAALSYPSDSVANIPLLGDFYLAHGYKQKYQYDDAAAHFNAALQRAETDFQRRAIAVPKLWVEFQAHRVDTSALLREAQALLPKITDGQTKAWVLAITSRMMRRHRDYRKALENLHAAVKLCPESDPSRAKYLKDLGFLYRLLALEPGEEKDPYYKNASALLVQAAGICELDRAWCKRTLAGVYVNQGLIAFDKGDSGSTCAYARKSLELTDDVIPAARAHILWSMGLFLARSEGAAREGYDHAHSAIVLAEPTDHRVFKRAHIWKAMNLLRWRGIKAIREAENCAEAGKPTADDRDYFRDEWMTLDSYIRNTKADYKSIHLPDGERIPVETLKQRPMSETMKVYEDEIIVQLIDLGWTMGDFQGIHKSPHVIAETARRHYRAVPRYSKSVN